VRAITAADQCNLSFERFQSRGGRPHPHHPRTGH
jgi:hypothetical protein